MAYYSTPTRSDELYHYGIKGMKWGVCRFENPDGSLTREGKLRYLKKTSSKEEYKAAKKQYKKDISDKYDELKANKQNYKRMYVPGIRRETARYMVNNNMTIDDARKKAIKKQLATQGILAGAKVALALAKNKLNDDYDKKHPLYTVEYDKYGDLHTVKKYWSNKDHKYVTKKKR